MTLTAPGCGMGEVIADEVCDKVLALAGVAEATVDIVFDPPWDRSMMSEAALLCARPVAARQPALRRRATPARHPGLCDDSSSGPHQKEIY
jgi:metal-sulfur cluster biosynthetic enzyme